MTPDDIDWPPPICSECEAGQHQDCPLSSGCECLDCPWLYEEAL